MKKVLVTALCSALAVAMAAPAFADHLLGGYFRTRFIMADVSKTKDGNKDPDKLIDQRFRARWQNNINEYITIVWYGEVDFQWGDAAFVNRRNDGGGLGGDSVNIETKHGYAQVKIPETPVSASVGLQSVADDWQSVLLDDDAAAVKVMAKMDMIDVTGIYAKFDEGDFKAEDDRDFWGLQVGLMPMGGLKLGVQGYWENDNRDGSDLYWVGVNGGYKLDMVRLSGQFVYNFGEESSSVDVSGYHAELQGAFTMMGADAGVRLFYFSGDNDANDANYFHSISNFYGYQDGGSIFFYDAYTNTYTGEANALNDAAHTDHGLWGATLFGKYVPPAMKAMYARAMVGYFAAVEDKTKRISEREGTSLGTEVALRVGYKIADKADVSFNGAYAFLGDFYDAAPGAGSDPDNLYKMYVMLNIPY